MIQVIEHGNRVKKHRCKFCGCLFSYTSSDIIKEKVDGGFFEPYTIKNIGIRCPECTMLTLAKELEKDE